jgi:hypothetical protein
MSIEMVQKSFSTSRQSTRSIRIQLRRNECPIMAGCKQMVLNPALYSSSHPQSLFSRL